MKNIKLEAENFINAGAQNYLPHLSIDCVIFGYENGQLLVLLTEFPNQPYYMLPSGYIEHNEHIDDAAQRNLKDRTGVDNVFLRQFYTFGKSNRSFPLVLTKLFQQYDIELPEDTWLLKRYVSIGYYALVNAQEVKPSMGIFDSTSTWKNAYQLPTLAMDHHEMVDQALATLREDLLHQPIGLNLLPHKFTMPDLQTLYETILNRKIDRGNFRRKILNANILNKLGESKKGVKHRAPHYYTFNEEAYRTYLEAELKIGF